MDAQTQKQLVGQLRESQDKSELCAAALEIASSARHDGVASVDQLVQGRAGAALVALCWRSSGDHAVLARAVDALGALLRAGAREETRAQLVRDGAPQLLVKLLSGLKLRAGTTDAAELECALYVATACLHLAGASDSRAALARAGALRAAAALLPRVLDGARADAAPADGGGDAAADRRAAISRAIIFAEVLCALCACLRLLLLPGQHEGGAGIAGLDDDGEESAIELALEPLLCACDAREAGAAAAARTAADSGVGVDAELACRMQQARMQGCGAVANLSCGGGAAQRAVERGAAECMARVLAEQLRHPSAGLLDAAAFTSVQNPDLRFPLGAALAQAAASATTAAQGVGSASDSSPRSLAAAAVRVLVMLLQKGGAVTALERLCHEDSVRALVGFCDIAMLCEGAELEAAEGLSVLCRFARAGAGALEAQKGIAGSRLLLLCGGVDTLLRACDISADAGQVGGSRVDDRVGDAGLLSGRRLADVTQALSDIAAGAGSTEQLASDGTISCLLRLFSADQELPVLRNISQLLACVSHGAAGRAMLAKQASVALVDVLGRVEDLLVWVNAVKAIADLAHSAVACTQLVEAGVAWPLVQLAGLTDHELIKSVARALAALVAHPESRDVMLQAGVVPLCKNVTADAVQEDAASALANMAVDEGSKPC
eukprot:g4491.t1